MFDLVQHLPHPHALDLLGIGVVVVVAVVAIVVNREEDPLDDDDDGDTP
jgi:hypothetical protein